MGLRLLADLDDGGVFQSALGGDRVVSFANLRRQADLHHIVHVAYFRFRHFGSGKHADTGAAEGLEQRAVGEFSDHARMDPLDLEPFIETSS